MINSELLIYLDFINKDLSDKLYNVNLSNYKNFSFSFLRNYSFDF